MSPSKRIRAAVLTIAIALGGAASAAPAQAQFFGDSHSSILCKTDFQLRRAIEREGYENVALNVELNNRIQARATRDGWVWRLTLNACSGRILEVEQVRPA